MLRLVELGHHTIKRYKLISIDMIKAHSLQTMLYILKLDQNSHGHTKHITLLPPSQQLHYTHMYIQYVGTSLHVSACSSQSNH